MKSTANTNTKRFFAALGAAAAAVAPALLFVGAGTAHADDSCYGALQYSYYCSPASGAGGGSVPGVQYTPAQPPFGFNNLPGCSGGALPAITGALSGEGC